MGNLSMGHMGKMAMGGKKGGKITSYTHSPAVTVSPLICFFHYSHRAKSMEREDWEIGEGNRTGDRTGQGKKRRRNRTVTGPNLLAHAACLGERNLADETGGFGTFFLFLLFFCSWCLLYTIFFFCLD